MDAVIMVAGVCLATLIIVGYVGVIWWLDRYEREPIWVVGLVFLWGGVGGTCLGCALSAPFQILAELLPVAHPQVWSAVVVAPFAEELTKGLVFAGLVLSDQFDNETDGLIYGAAAGLGFAAVENLIYYVGGVDGGVVGVLSLVVMRTLFSALVHCISSAILGMAIGYVRHRRGPGRWLKYPIAAYLLAVANHAAWNFTAAAAGAFEASVELEVAFHLVGIALVLAAAVVMFVLTQLSLSREQAVIERYLAREADRGTLPAAHAAIVASWRKRRKSGWLAGDIPRKAYVKVATLLAFRRHQKDIASPERAAHYERDIAEYRGRIRQMRAASAAESTGLDAPTGSGK